MTEQQDQPDDTASTEPTDKSNSADLGTNDPEETQEEPDTFPRTYVKELRQENGRYRQRAQKGDVFAQRLHTELVRATGKLADPTDIAFDETHLDDPDALTAALDDLITRKPHLANRRPTGDIGQGAASGGTANVDLAAILRQTAN